MIPLREIIRLFFRYIKEEKHTRRLSLSIPFIFRLTLTKHLFWQGGISVRFLIFSFGVHKYGGLGWYFWPNIEKWDVYWRIHMKKILVSFHIGLPKILFMGWKMRRLERKIRLKEGLKDFGYD